MPKQPATWVDRNVAEETAENRYPGGHVRGISALPCSTA